MKKVSFITRIKLTYFGGGEKWLIDLGNELSNRGYEVEVISPNWIPLKEIERINLNDLKKLIRFDYKITIKMLFKFGNFTELFRILDSDYIYIMDVNTSVFQIFLSLYNKSDRIILGNHGISFLYRHKSWKLKMSILNLLKNKILKYQHKIYIHVLNSAQKKFYERLGFKNVYLVPNFINSREYFYPKNTNEFIVEFMGRFVAQKGIELLPQIIKEILDENKEIKFYIAGSGDKKYEEMLKSLENKYPENVKYFGFIDENTKKEILSKSSLFFAPSKFETGVPTLAIAEALVSGSPFLGSNIVAFRDLLNLYDKNFGWIEKNYNSEAFANKILEIYNLWKEDPKGYFERRKYIAKRARKLFDIKRVVDEFERVFLS